VITRIEARGYRSLRCIACRLERKQILVGGNGSGKTTFLDVFAFLSDLVSDGFDAAFGTRTRQPLDLFWMRQPGAFEIAIEARIPETLRPAEAVYEHIRYELSVEIGGGTSEPEIREESALLLSPAARAHSRDEQPELFPRDITPPQTILLPKKRKGIRTVFRKSPEGNDNYYSERDKKAGKGWFPSFRLGSKKSAFHNLMDDPERFPAATWLRERLRAGVQRTMLNSLAIRNPSPPGSGSKFRPDGSNLPWAARSLKENQPERFSQWVAHVRTAIPDLEDIRIVVREEDLHAYLVVRYKGGLEVPSWTVSDGTLRLMALTILPYLPVDDDLFLIEEPENGIHPTGVETVYQSLSSVYRGQVLLATHSTVLLALAKPEDLLCFAKTPGGATDVIRGDEHPVLRDWKKDVSLADLLAAGILG
jgi:ABC-type transport system involved in cytochrome c biogenesis ATPase subunit